MGPIGVLFVISIAFFVGCMFVDPIVVILVLVPIFAPVVHRSGLDPVLVGTIITLQVAIGSATPPFGCDIFTAIAVFKRPYIEVIRGTPPFIVILLGVAVAADLLPADRAVPARPGLREVRRTAMFKKILVGRTTARTGRASALDKAAELAKLCDAEMMVLTVYRHHTMLEASLSMVRGATGSAATWTTRCGNMPARSAEDAKAARQGGGRRQRPRLHQERPAGTHDRRLRRRSTAAT